MGLFTPWRKRAGSTAEQSLPSETAPDVSLDRVDGPLKVTGEAMYSAEYHLDGMCYAMLVTSTIAKGKIVAIDSGEAAKTPGVSAVISHLNSPGVPGYGAPAKPTQRAATGTALRVFHDELIYFSGQPVALVVADSPERAAHAAALVKVKYESEPHRTDFEGYIQKSTVPMQVQRNKNSPFQDYTRGQPPERDAAAEWIEASYTIPTQHHQPLEPHAIVAVWEAADRLTVYDKNQGVKSVQGNLSQLFKLPRENVRVISPFIGGAFGSGIRVWPHTIAAVIAARVVQRPVKLVLGRDQMFTSVGYRPHTEQTLRISGTRDGKLLEMHHEGTGQTSSYEEHLERTILATRVMYSCPHVTTRYRLLPLDVSTPTWMRGPGDATGMFALESALDELAWKLGIDPLEIRLINHADSDPERNLPWSAKSLKTCYQMGAEKFGWKNRAEKPGTMKTDEEFIGYGMASSLYGFHRHPSRARALWNADGSVLLQSATMDIGPGTGTAMIRIAARLLGVAPSRIRIELGDSSLPDAPGQNGSATIPSVGSAVHAVSEALAAKMKQLARALPDSELQSGSLELKKGHLVTPSGKKVSIREVLSFHKLESIEANEESRPGAERDQYSMYSFGCHFIEVGVNRFTGEVRIKRVVTCADVGSIVNPKTARSQSIGGIVGGIGMALMEASVIDHRSGRYITHDFNGYSIPVHADVPDIEVLFVDQPDVHVNPIGAKGLGEIAIVGVAAAIANAVFHATGKRIRKLPITPDQLI